MSRPGPAPGPALCRLHGRGRTPAGQDLGHQRRHARADPVRSSRPHPGRPAAARQAALFPRHGLLAVHARGNAHVRRAAGQRQPLRGAGQAHAGPRRHLHPRVPAAHAGQLLRRPGQDRPGLRPGHLCLAVRARFPRPGLPGADPQGHQGDHRPYLQGRPARPAGAVLHRRRAAGREHRLDQRPSPGPPRFHRQAPASHRPHRRRGGHGPTGGRGHGLRTAHLRPAAPLLSHQLDPRGPGGEPAGPGSERGQRLPARHGRPGLPEHLHVRKRRAHLAARLDHRNHLPGLPGAVGRGDDPADPGHPGRAVHLTHRAQAARARVRRPQGGGRAQDLRVGLAGHSHRQG